MPAYAFKCKNCGGTETKVLQISERDKKFKCKKCKHGLRRTMQTFKITFVGSGFYVNDSKKK